MTAMTKNTQPLAWAHGFVKSSNRAAGTTYAASVHGYLGAMTISVDGTPRPAVSGTSMAALCTNYPGADADGGMYLSARTANVTLQLLGGTSKTLGVASITYGSTIAIVIQQATDGGGLVTSTANDTVNLIRGNAETDRLLRAKATGTGAGLTATTGATTIAFITLLGVANQEFDASQVLNDCDTFDVGQWGAIPDTAVPPVLNAIAYIIDDQTVSGSADALSIQVPYGLLDARGLAYVNLEEAR